MTDPEYLSINEICERFHVSRSCVERAWSEGRLRWCGVMSEDARPRRSVMMFDLADVLAWKPPLDVSDPPKPRREPLTKEERKAVKRIEAAERRLVAMVKAERDDRPMWARVKPYFAPTTTWDGAIGDT